MAYVKRLTIHNTLIKAIEYIENEDKTDSGVLISSNLCSSEPKIAIQEMMLLKKNYHKEDGIQGFHFIQSFKKGEVTNEQVHQIGLDWAKKFLDDNYQYILTTHIDKGHIHNHIIINSVGMDGRKYNSCENELADIRTYSDLTCLEHEVSIITPKYLLNKSYYEWSESQKKNSWKDTYRSDIDYAISMSNNMDDFIRYMKEQDYNIRYKDGYKSITFTNLNINKNIRGKTLGADYTVDRIKKRIELKEYNIKLFKSKTYKYKCSKSVWQMALDKIVRKRGSIETNLLLVGMLFMLIFNKNKKSQFKKSRPVKYSYAQKNAIRNINNLSKCLGVINKYNITKRSDIESTEELINKKTEKVAEAKMKLLELKSRASAVCAEIEMYYTYKVFSDEFKKSILREVYKKNHEYELEKFDLCKEKLAAFGIKEENFLDFLKEYEEIKGKLKDFDKTLNSLYEEQYEIQSIKLYLNRNERRNIVDKIELCKEDLNKPEGESKNRNE